MKAIVDTRSLPELLDRFKDEKTCIEYYEHLRWSGNPVCPHCASRKPYKTKKGYRCSNKDCKKDFTVMVGSIFHSTKISLRLWFAAIFLYRTHKKGISSVQLATYLNITQKTAWHMLHRLRKIHQTNNVHLIGMSTQIVEVDETYVGGREKNRHGKKKQSRDNGYFSRDGYKYKKKKIVIGAIERGGKVILRWIPRASIDNMIPFIEDHVLHEAEVMTDEHKAYETLNGMYEHSTVIHSRRIYKRGNTHTNTIENFWSTLKRSISGVYYHISDKHFERYLDEFSGRFNTRNTSVMHKFNSLLANSEGRLSYEELTRNYD